MLKRLRMPAYSDGMKGIPMATPRRVFTIYQKLAEDAETVRDFQVAQGEKVSGTVNLLLSGNRDKLLQRWGEEMAELCGVLDGTHDDSYLMECTQCFYWGSLFAVTGGLSFDDLDLVNLMQQAAGHPQLSTRRSISSSPTPC